jgi:hypothetical protein
MNNVLRHKTSNVKVETRDAARHDLLAYIEGYYNRQRLPSERQAA